MTKSPPYRAVDVYGNGRLNVHASCIQAALGQLPTRTLKQIIAGMQRKGWSQTSCRLRIGNGYI